MTKRYIFHLSIPVSDLSAAERFYVNVLDGVVGRRDPSWIDVLIWGHQITLQLRPAEVLTLEQQGKRHFGVTLPWAEWEAFAAKLTHSGISFLSSPERLLVGTPQEQAKLYLEDPSHNIIEIKTYRDLRMILGNGDASYEYPAD